MIRFEPGLFNCNHPSALTECFLGYAGSTTSCCTRHWWDEDVAAFEAELKVLKTLTGDSDRANVSALLARKKEGVTAIAEVSSTCVDVKASLIVVYSSMPSFVQNGRRTAMQIVAPNYLTSGLNVSKSRRHIYPLGVVSHASLDSIKARCLPLGYSEKDVNQLRRHREVRISKPMSDRGKSWHHRPLPTNTQRS